MTSFWATMLNIFEELEKDRNKSDRLTRDMSVVSENQAHCLMWLYNFPDGGDTPL